MGGLRLLLDGLTFAESPRWHGGRLWFSDIFAHRVMAVDPDGKAEVVVAFDHGELPSGLGFLPDGSLLIVDLSRPRLFRLDSAKEISVYADLSDLAVGALNDMAVDSAGLAYVGTMGTHSSRAPRPVNGDGRIILVDPTGAARVVADGLDAPNGPGFLDDESRFVVSEFPASRLTAFDRAADGSLGPARLWADLSPGAADGIATDSAGAVWTASPRQGQCRRITEGGLVTHTVPVAGKVPLACAVGGEDGRTLFILSVIGTEAEIIARTCTSVIDTIRIEL